MRRVVVIEKLQNYSEYGLKNAPSDPFPFLLQELHTNCDEISSDINAINQVAKQLFNGEDIPAITTVEDEYKSVKEILQKKENVSFFVFFFFFLFFVVFLFFFSFFFFGLMRFNELFDELLT